jgi:methylase of polypeptide subunit release factors
VADLLRSRGFADIETHRDLAGIHRVTLGRWRGSEAY